MPLNQTKSSKSSKPSLVVGMGASAGGLAALKRVFSKLNQVEGVPFIVAQHQDSGDPFLAAEMFKNFIHLPILEIKNGMKLDRGHVYLVPSRMSVTIENHQFVMEPAVSVDEKLTVIDHLFTSIGKEFGVGAVGVVLSGNASDGSTGIRDLYEAGGLTLVQNPESAEHSSMPENAIATGAVDYVLQPEQIADEIVKHVGYIQDLEKRGDQNALKTQIISAITSICEILQRKTHHDFKHYKTSTLVRRILRRMHVLQSYSVEDYIGRLNDQAEEVDALFKDLLIHVTSFFRDPEAFESLRTEVVSKLVADRSPEQKIRVWIAGCSTGEEAYSIAILFRELFEQSAESPEVQIIATDLDEVALNTARRGSYSANIAEQVSPERLSKYFTKQGGRYHVKKGIREMCLFSIHNLINDPPFSQIDLISCRNLLIYLGAHLQKKLFPVFHYSLKPGGFLFLGTSESLTSHQELFNSVNVKHRIAQRKATAIRMQTPVAGSIHHYLSHIQDSSAKTSEANLNLIGQRIALDEMPLTYAVVNEDGNILSASAGLNKYLEIPEGAFHNNIIKLSKPSLRPALRKVFGLAKKEKRKELDEGCTINIGSNVERVGVIVQPMPQLGEETGLYWVAFQYLGSASQRERENSDDETFVDSEVVEQLERELASLREDLDKSVQDLEASNEELKSSNEELLSMNEELQSANEELETSKEDVQSTNDALLRSYSDLENLLSATQIATLFLADDLKIRGFTPAMMKIYRLNAGDVGRDIRDFTTYASTVPVLPETSEVDDVHANEIEFTMPNGMIFLRRIIPYWTHERTRDGVVVTFLDITSLRRAEASRRESEGRFQMMADHAPVLIWIAGLDKVCTWFNKGWLEWTGHSMEHEVRHGWAHGVHPEDLEQCLKIYHENFDAHREFYVEYRRMHHSGEYRWISGRGVPRFAADGIFEGYIGGCMDIHDSKILRDELAHAKNQAELANQSKTRFLANMSHEIRTPLAAILGFSTLLKNHRDLNPEANSHIDRIGRNANHLSRLIDELLDLSKIESDRLDVEKVPIQVDSLIEDVFSIIQLRAQEKGLDFRFEWLGSKPKVIVTDGVRLAQILSNVVGNAIKFTESGSVIVSLNTANSMLSVRVTDTGIGLTREQQSRIFEPFMQADSSVTRKYGGTGLGLALSRRLAKLLGGRLELEKSEAGKGSVFSFEIPIGSEEEELKSLGEEELRGNILKDCKVLIVDDSPDNRVIVSYFLQSVGAETVEAVNGLEGCQKAGEGVDLILMDIQMPVMDGYQALQKLKETHSSIPVIALTAHAFKEEKDRCLKAGFDSYLSKPVSSDLLIRKIAKILKRH